MEKTDTHWLAEAQRKGVRIVIREYPNCWAAITFGKSGGHVERGLYYETLPELMDRLAAIGIDSSSLPVEPRSLARAKQVVRAPARAK